MKPSKVTACPAAPLSKSSIDATVTSLNAVGPIDRLFYCAGVPHTTGPLNCMLVNWVGLRYLTERLLPNIADGGAIASISSVAASGRRTFTATA